MKWSPTNVINFFRNAASVSIQSLGRVSEVTARGNGPMFLLNKDNYFVMVLCYKMIHSII